MPGYPNIGSIAGGMTDMTLDLQNIQLNQAKLQEAPIKLEAERIELIKDKISLAQQMKMLSLMQNVRIQQSGAANDPDGMAGVLDQMSMIQLESGQVDNAAKTAGEAARLRDTASKVDTRTYRVQNDRLSKFSNILSATPDTPDGFKQAIAMVLATDPTAAKDKKFMQVAQMQWRPGLVPMLQKSVLTAKEQAEVNYRSAAEKHADAAAKADDARVALIKEQTKLAADRDKNLIKATGQPAVKADQLRTITDLATVDYPGADPADIRVRSRPLAEEMVKMMRDQDLTQSEAGRRVYEQARSSGTFSGLRMMPTQKGTKAGVPLALPQAKDEKDFEKKLQENQWYNVGGVPKLWMGGQFFTEEELKNIDQEDKDELGDDEEAEDEE